MREIKLNDDDMEKLADLPATRLEQKLLRTAMSQAGYDAVSARAKIYADSQINSVTFIGEAADRLRDVLNAEGGKMLQVIVGQAMLQVCKDDPELIKAARARIFKHSLDAAQEAARRLGLLDEMN